MTKYTDVNGVQIRVDDTCLWTYQYWAPTANLVDMPNEIVYGGCIEKDDGELWFRVLTVKANDSGYLPFKTNERVRLSAMDDVQKDLEVIGMTTLCIPRKHVERIRAMAVDMKTDLDFLCEIGDDVDEYSVDKQRKYMDVLIDAIDNPIS